MEETYCQWFQGCPCSVGPVGPRFWIHSGGGGKKGMRQLSVSRLLTVTVKSWRLKTLCSLWKWTFTKAAPWFRSLVLQELRLSIPVFILHRNSKVFTVEQCTSKSCAFTTANVQLKPDHKGETVSVLSTGKPLSWHILSSQQRLWECGACCSFSFHTDSLS